MRVFISVLCLLWPIMSFAQRDPLNANDHINLALHDNKILDEEFLQVRVNGERYFHRFMQLYAYPNSDSEHYIIIQLNEYLAALNSVDGGEVLTDSEALRFVDLFTTFTRAEQITTIQINGVPRDRSFSEAVTFYSIGGLFAIDRLERDVHSKANAELLKKRILRALAPLIAQQSNGMLDGTSWRMMYLDLVYSYFGNFDAEVVNDLARLAANEIRTAPEGGFRKRAANNLLLEISLLCASRCTQPTIKRSGGFVTSLDFFLKSVLSTCFRDCRSGLGWNPRAFGFNRMYLDFLQRTRDPDYDNVRSDMLFDSAKMYLSGSKFSLKNALDDQPWVYTKQALGELTDSLYFFFAWVLTSAQLILFTVTFLLLAFTGTNKFQPQHPQFKSTKRPWRQVTPVLITNAYRALMSLFSNIKLLGIKLIQNLHDGFMGGTPEVTYRIASNLFVSGLTLFISTFGLHVDKHLV